MYERRKSVKGMRRFMGVLGSLAVLKYYVALPCLVYGAADIGLVLWMYFIYRQCER